VPCIRGIKSSPRPVLLSSCTRNSTSALPCFFCTLHYHSTYTVTRPQGTMVHNENACIGNIYDTLHRVALNSNIGSILSVFKAFNLCTEPEYFKTPGLLTHQKLYIVHSLPEKYSGSSLYSLVISVLLHSGPSRSHASFSCPLRMYWCCCRPYHSLGWAIQ
jgi:hypothetical protein